MRQRLLFVASLVLAGCADEEFVTDVAADPTDDLAIDAVAADPRVPGEDSILLASAEDSNEPRGLKSFQFTNRDIVVDVGVGHSHKQLRQATDSIRRTIRFLTEHGEADASKRLNDELDAALHSDLSRDRESRLHVVGLYEGMEKKSRNRDSAGTAIVRVSDTNGPVTLCVCAYDPVDWTIELDEGVRLERVIVSGSYKQTINGLPKGIPVEGRLTDAKNSKYSFSAYTGAASWARVDQQLRSLTGMSVATRFGEYRFSGAPIVAGPQNADWVAQMKLRNLQPILQRAVAAWVANAESDLTRSVFPAIWMSPTNRDGELGHGGNASITTATVFGPYVETMQPLQTAVRQVIQHPTLGLISIANNGLVSIDSETGKLTNIDIPELEPVSSDCAMAFNEADNRLYLWGKHLVSVELKSQQITVHRDDNPSVLAIVWSSHDNCLYGMTAPYDGSSGSSIREIRKFNRRGAELERISIDASIPSSGHRGQTQVFEIDGRLVVLASQLPGQQKQNYVIDPRTGRTEFVAVSKPR